jgi:hypothetical protein
VRTARRAKPLLQSAGADKGRETSTAYGDRSEPARAHRLYGADAKRPLVASAVLPDAMVSLSERKPRHSFGADGGWRPTECLAFSVLSLSSEWAKLSPQIGSF